MTEITLPEVPPAMHGQCPNCSVSLDGEGVWLHFYHRFMTEGYWLAEDGSYTDELRILSHEEAVDAADTVAGSYGASHVKGRFGKAIGIIENDRCRKTACLECGAIWDGNGKVLDEKYDVAAYKERRAHG